MVILTAVRDLSNATAMRDTACPGRKRRPESNRLMAVLQTAPRTLRHAALGLSPISKHRTGAIAAGQRPRTFTAINSAGSILVPLGVPWEPGGVTTALPSGYVEPREQLPVLRQVPVSEVLADRAPPCVAPEPLGLGWISEQRGDRVSERG